MGVGVGRWGTRGEGKDMFREGDMSRNVNPTGDKIQAAIALVFVGVPEKNAGNRARRKLVWGGGGSIGKAETAEDSKLGIIGMTKEQGVERRGV